MNSLGRLLDISVTAVAVPQRFPPVFPCVPSFPLSVSVSPALQSAHLTWVSPPTLSPVSTFPIRNLTHINRPGSFVLCQIINVTLDSQCGLGLASFLGLICCVSLSIFRTLPVCLLVPACICLHACLPVSKLPLNTLWSVSSSAFVLSAFGSYPASSPNRYK